VPLYEYRCTTCEATFELRRPAADSSAPATCPEGHAGGRRLLSLFATAGRAAGAPSGASPMAGGCGAGCACAAAAAH